MRGHLFLDLDGVFADFDGAAGAAIGTDNTYKWEWVNGSKAFWEKLDAVPHFFRTFPAMPDAYVLWDALEVVPLDDKSFLTAVPKDDARRPLVEADKRHWVRAMLNSDAHVITCLTSEKPLYCQPGDILVDDRRVNEEAWEARGGTFVYHTSAASTIERLRELNVLL